MEIFDTPTLSSLRRQLQARSMERDSAAAFFQRDVATMDEAHSQLTESLALAQDALSVRRRQAGEVERDMLRQSALQNRQLSYKEDKIARHEESASELRKQLLESEGALHSYEQRLAESRQQLSQVQQQADGCLQRIRADEGKLAEARRTLQLAVVGRRAAADQHEHSRASLEQQLRTQESLHAAALEQARQMTIVASELELQHSLRMEDMKRRVSALHDEFDTTKRQLTNVRQSLTTLQEDEEDAARRRRKTEEDTTREYLLERKAEVAQLCSQREEVVRQLRADLDRQASMLQASVDEATASLQPLREECSRIFDMEMRLMDDMNVIRESTQGIEEFKERLRCLKEQSAKSTATADELSEVSERQNGVLKALTDEIHMLKEIVAPINDVETNIGRLNEQLHENRQHLADLEAKRVIQQVALEGKIQGIEVESSRLQSVILSFANRKVQATADIAERRRQLEADQHVLIAEAEAVEARLQDMHNRNKLLDATLEHHARQKKLLQEDLENRRELARRAAASLLAQLEE